jgi:hypothetical protein
MQATEVLGWLGGMPWDKDASVRDPAAIYVEAAMGDSRRRARLRFSIGKGSSGWQD